MWRQVVERVEATLRVKRFNQLGGLQLDRDVRSLVGTLSNVTQRTVRDKFAVLNQMGAPMQLSTTNLQIVPTYLIISSMPRGRVSGAQCWCKIRNYVFLTASFCLAGQGKFVAGVLLPW